MTAHRAHPVHISDLDDELTEASALRALVAAAAKVDVACQPADLIRIGSNAVFRLPDSVIARVARSAGLLEEARKQVEVARWLQSLDYPATRALGVAQPVVADGRVTTFWESVSDREEYAPIADVAELVRRLHALPPPGAIDLPRLAPFGSSLDPVPRFPGLAAEDEEYLSGRLLWARETFEELPFELEPGHVHGDANVGNVLQGTDGPVLIDLDSFAVGPREWDLIQTAIFYDRLGWHTEDEYRIFVDVYGYDLTKWAGYPELAEMRELAMTAWMSRKASRIESAAREATKRIQAIRTGGNRRDWAPY